MTAQPAAQSAASAGGQAKASAAEPRQQHRGLGGADGEPGDGALDDERAERRSE